MLLLVGLAIYILPFVGAEAAHHKADGDQVELLAESPCQHGQSPSKVASERRLLHALVASSTSQMVRINLLGISVATYLLEYNSVVPRSSVVDKDPFHRPSRS